MNNERGNNERGNAVVIFILILFVIALIAIGVAMANVPHGTESNWLYELFVGMYK